MCIRDSQALARRHNDAASSWIADRRLEFAALEIERGRRRLDPEGEIVRSLERGLDRHVRPFRLDIRVLAVAGFHAWLTSPARVLVTIAMWKNLDAYRDWLGPVIQALV